MYLDKNTNISSCSICDEYNPNNPKNIKKGKLSQSELQELNDNFNNCVNIKCNDGKQPEPEPKKNSITKCTDKCYSVCDKIPQYNFSHNELLEDCLQGCNNGDNKSYMVCNKWLNDNATTRNNIKSKVAYNKTKNKNCINNGCNIDNISFTSKKYETDWSVDCNKGCNIDNDKCNITICPTSTKKYYGKCLSNKKMDPIKKYTKHPNVIVPIKKKWCNNKKIESFINKNINYRFNYIIICFILFTLFTLFKFCW